MPLAALSRVYAVQRLKTRPQFQAALAGKTLARTTHFALHSMSLECAKPEGDAMGPDALFPGPCLTWLGALVPKRWARRAVTRNTIKRQIYNVSQHFETSLPQGAYVVRLRCAFDRKVFISASSDVLKQAVRTELTELFDRAGARGSAPKAI